MRLTKIATLILSGVVALSSVDAVASAKKTSTTKVVKKTTVKKTAKEKNSTAVKSVSKSAKKQPVKKVSAKVTKKETKVTANHKNPTLGAQTKKLYGVVGAAIKPTKVSTSTATYNEKGKSYTIIGKEASKHFSQTGIASYYGGKFHGRKTANGEIFDKNKFTAAHKTLALGSYALVTNLQNGRKLIVRINDRGPYSSNRILDLSKRAAQELGMIKSGTARVKVEAMQVDKDGYIIGNGAKALYELARKEGLPLKVRGEGKTLAIKADPKGKVPTTALKPVANPKTEKAQKTNKKPIEKTTATAMVTKPNTSEVISVPAPVPVQTVGSSQTRNTLKVIRLPDETQAKKVLSSIKARSAQIQPTGDAYEVNLELTSQQEMMQTKHQLSRLGYTVFSYIEE